MRLQRRLAASPATPARATAPRLTGPPKGVERAPPGAGGRSRRVGQEPGLPGRGEVACLIKHKLGVALPHPRAGMKSNTQEPPVVQRAAHRALRGLKAESRDYLHGSTSGSARGWGRGTPSLCFMRHTTSPPQRGRVCVGAARGGSRRPGVGFAPGLQALPTPAIAPIVHRELTPGGPGSDLRQGRRRFLYQLPL
jgi:hypothetical protein